MAGLKLSWRPADRLAQDLRAPQAMVRHHQTFSKERLTIVQERLLREVRIWLVVFIVGLGLSGVTAFPLETELHWLLFMLNTSAVRPIALSFHLLPWIARVSDGLTRTNASYPFLAYGTDWLAFGHLVIATVFIGPYRDPVRNKWIIDFGLIACAGVIPLALIAGHARGIPFPWRLVDCSFGVFGALPLLRCKALVGRIESTAEQTSSNKERI